MLIRGQESKAMTGDFGLSEMLCYWSSKGLLMHNCSLLPSLKLGSWSSPQLNLVLWSCKASQGFTAPNSCEWGLQRSLPVLVNHWCPFSLAVSVMGFHSFSVWLMSHYTEQTSEPEDCEASGSAIQPNILLLNISRRGIPWAAALSHVMIPTNCQGWLANCHCWCYS